MAVHHEAKPHAGAEETTPVAPEVTRTTRESVVLSCNLDGATSELVQVRDAKRVPFHEGYPVRRFGHYFSQRRNPGWYWCATNQAHVEFESRLEYLNLFLMDFDRKVEWILEQPLRIHYRWERAKRSHVPDFLLRLDGGGYRLVNVARRVRLAKPEVAERHAVARYLCRRLGWDYQVMSEPDLVRFRNLKVLAARRTRPSNANVFEDQLLAAAVNPTPICAVEGAVGPSPLVRPTLLHLLWTGRLCADLDVRLTEQTQVWRTGQ